MKIIDLNNDKYNYNTGIALGNFDGIHIGHQYLIKDSIKKANEKGLEPSILLFKNHTKTIINNQNNKVYLLTSNEQKLRILKEMGIKIVYTLLFDREIMKLSAEKFVEEILINKLNTKLVTAGFDYRFGYKALGDSNYLKELGEKYNFETNIIMPIYVDEEIVSSTKIRNLIKIGEIKKANEFLGRPYSLVGNVVKGDQRGSKMGYPTANIQLSYNYAIPKTGVYETITLIENKKFVSLTNIGYNPTFNGKKLKIENHIIDFDEDIYGRKIEIKFMDFIREDIKFNTVKELIEKIAEDINYIKDKNIYN